MPIGDGFRVTDSRRVDVDGGLTLAAEDELITVVNPTGAETIVLPAEAPGLAAIIKNDDGAADVVTVNDDGATTQATLAAGESAILFCDGTEWHGLVGATT